MNRPAWIGRGDMIPLDGPEEPADGGAAAGEALDLRRIWSAIRRNLYLIAGIFAAAILIAFVLTILSRPLFTATASIQIEQQTAKVLASEDSEALAGGGAADADRFLQTQVDILKSRSIALRVAAMLHLARDDLFVKKMGAKPPVPRPGIDLRSLRQDQVIDLLTKNLRVELPRNSRVALISFVSPDPQLAAQVADSFADTFIVANLQRRYDTTAYARDFLEKRLNDVRQRLQGSERDMIGYARSARLIDASNAANGSETAAGGASGPKSLTTAELVQLSAATTQAQTARIAAEGRWTQARRTPLMNLPEVLANPTIQALVLERSQLAAAYEQEKQRRKAEYPTMIQAAARIAELDQQITGLATDIRQSIEGAYRTAAGQEQALSGDVEQLKSATLAEQDRGIRYNILKRDVDTNRSLYDGLLQRYKEVSAEAGVTSNNISIVDRAIPPRAPTSPRLSVNLAIALLLAALASAATVFGRETFDDRIRAPDDVPRKLGVPLLATIPVLARDKVPLQELEQPRSEMSEAFQTLRGALDLSTREGAPRTLLITSSRPAEGKSTAAYAVARSFARLGRKTLLIDADMRRPSLHRTLGLSNQAGLSGLLAHQQEIAAVAQPTEVAMLEFIASGALPPNPAELLTGEILSDLLARLRAIYEVVVIDGPPVLGLADAVQLASAVEGIAFVVEANAGHFGGVKTSLRRIAASGRPILGVILNKFDLKSAAYSYSYAYNYEYRYSQDTTPS